MNDACCCIEVEPDGRASVHRTTIPTARVQHKCGECGGRIVPGDQYESHRGLYDGEWRTHKTCRLCLAIRRDYFPCGWYWGMLVDDFADCYGFDYRKVPDDE